METFTYTAPDGAVITTTIEEIVLPENFSVSDCETAFFNKCPNMGGVCQEVCEHCPEFALRERDEA